MLYQHLQIPYFYCIEQSPKRKFETKICVMFFSFPQNGQNCFWCFQWNKNFLNIFFFFFQKQIKEYCTFPCHKLKKRNFVVADFKVTITILELGSYNILAQHRKCDICLFQHHSTLMCGCHIRRCLACSTYPLIKFVRWCTRVSACVP